MHVGPGGVHIDTLEDDGRSVHTNADGTVTIDGETFSSWKEAHDKLDHHGKHFHTKVGRAWNKFPFPAVVALAYLVLGIVYGTWSMGLFLVFWFPSTTQLATLSIDAICQNSLNASIQQPPSLGSSTCGSVWDSPILHGSSSSRFPS